LSAPLATAFHAAVFCSAAKYRVIVNIGGIANLTDLPDRGAITSTPSPFPGWPSKRLMADRVTCRQSPAQAACVY